LVFWGITDATSWLGGYPLLFDAEYKAKPAFYAIVNSVPPLPTEPPVQVIPGDVNGDGRVNSSDLTLMKRYLLKSISDFPTPEGKNCGGFKRRRQGKLDRFVSAEKTRSERTLIKNR